MNNELYGALLVDCAKLETLRHYFRGYSRGRGGGDRGAFRGGEGGRGGGFR